MAKARPETNEFALDADEWDVELCDDNFKLEADEWDLVPCDEEFKFSDKELSVKMAVPTETDWKIVIHHVDREEGAEKERLDLAKTKDPEAMYKYDLSDESYLYPNLCEDWKIVIHHVDREEGAEKERLDLSKTKDPEAMYKYDLSDESYLYPNLCEEHRYLTAGRMDDYMLCYGKVFTWIIFETEFHKIRYSPGIIIDNTINGSWFNIFYHSTQAATPDNEMFISFAIFVVIYGWVVEGLLEWKKIFEQLQNLDTVNIKNSVELSKSKNEKGFLMALVNSLQHIKDVIVAQNFLNELKSCKPPTFIISTLIRILEGLTEPKSIKDIRLDELMQSYFSNMRALCSTFKEKHIPVEIKVHLGENIWAMLEPTTVLCGINLSNALLEKFCSESRRIIAKYSGLSENVDVWTIRKQYIDILHRIAAATGMDVKIKFIISRCKYCNRD